MHIPPLLAFDFLDPWSWVAQRRLALAMSQVGQPLKVTFQPCRSPLSRAAAGMAYHDFLERRFGTQALIQQSLVAAEMRQLGIEPAFSQIVRLPDTRPALAAVLWLQRSGKPAHHFVESVFEALYCHGQDIGDPAVLKQLLLRERVALSEVVQFMHSDTFSEELQASEATAAAWAGRVIPSLRINGTVVFGAQTPSVLAPMLGFFGAQQE
ncbi:DsbA family protein [Pseudomonas anuradhapurensis]|uniref:DsbA family oxidoreductase n=1 Tax=Pseudomonas anuradhapurensis TaxID=485870 RepID=UPI0016482DFC|nr:DsbA family protein [Pseudomonas anuradhapurensis]QXI49379.1 DsbA family protein [Pseudomonas anuradhapurensis]